MWSHPPNITEYRYNYSEQYKSVWSTFCYSVRFYHFISIYIVKITNNNQYLVKRKMKHSRTLGTDFHLFLQRDNALCSSRRSMGFPPGWVLRNTWYMKLCGFLHERLITTIRCFAIRYTKGDNSIGNVSMLLTVLLMYSCFHIDNGVTNSYK